MLTAKPLPRRLAAAGLVAGVMLVCAPMASADFSLQLDVSQLAAPQIQLQGATSGLHTFPTSNQTVSLPADTYSLLMGGSSEVMNCNVTVSGSGTWGDSGCASDVSVTGGGTTLTITGFPISIDASAAPALTDEIAVNSVTSFFSSPRTLNVVPLGSGESYLLQPGSGQVSACSFNVDNSGNVTYPGACEGALTGAGTKTVDVHGDPVQIDATHLKKNDGFLLPGNSVLGQDPQPSNASHTYQLLPLTALSYSLRTTPLASFQGTWNVGIDGNVTVGLADAGWESASGNKLTVTGFPIQIDATALGTGTFGLEGFLFFNNTGTGTFPQTSVLSMYVAPGPFHLVNSSYDFQFSAAEADGKISTTPASIACVSGQGTSKLTLGCRPTVTVTTPPQGANYTLNQSVNASYSCAAGGGGAVLTSCSGTVANGSPIDTSTPGTHTFTVTATEGDQTTTVSHTYTVGVNGMAGYVWADMPTATSYTPSLSYQYNTTGAHNTITRFGTGTYEITFPGIGSAGGTVDVTGYTTTGLCKTSGWSEVGTAEAVDVVCFNNAGVLADTKFTAAYTQPVSPAGRLAYLWDESPSAPTDTPASAYQYNSAGGLGTVTRSAAGIYHVSFPGQALADGTVKVTAVGPRPTTCQVVNWGRSGTAEVVNVNCFDLRGRLTDSQFAVTFAYQTNLLAVGPLHTAYVWSGRSGTAYTYNSTGGTVTIANPSTGVYTVTMNGEGAFGSGDVQVATYGGTGICNSGGWTKSGSNAVATVDCYTVAGASSSLRFTLQWMTN